MFVFTISDGVTKTQQVLLHDPTPENLESVWDQHVVAMFHHKTSNPESFTHGEFMNMRGCEPVRRYMFYYDLSEESKAVFKDVMTRRNPKMSILVVLAPRTDRLVKMLADAKMSELYPGVDTDEADFTRLYQAVHGTIQFPRLVNTVLGVEVTPSDITQTTPEGAYENGRFTRDVGFVFRIYDDHHDAVVETPLLDVDETGRTAAEQIHGDLMTHLRASFEDPSALSRVHELTYHVQCGMFTKRYYLHYDASMTHERLDTLISDHSDLPAQTSFRIVFVPRTPVTESILWLPGEPYPILIDAGRQEETLTSSFGRGRPPLRL